MNFRGSERQRLPQPKLFRPDRIAEALAELCENKAPTGRRKYAEKRFGLEAEEARRLIEGRASKAIIDKAFRNAGWSAVLEAFALFFDQGVDQHIEQMRRLHADHAQRLGAMAGALRPPADLHGGRTAVSAGLADRVSEPTDRRVGKGSLGRPG